MEIIHRAAAPTILILTAPTGGGHDSTARGLAEALLDAAPGMRVRLYNPLSREACSHDIAASPHPVGLPRTLAVSSLLRDKPLPRVGHRDSWSGIGRGYDAVTAYVPALWGAFYHLTNREWAVRAGVSAAWPMWGRRLREVIQAERPDLVVSVHPLCTRLAARALTALSASTPHHCVVTDLVTVHRCWAAAGVRAFYVATADAALALTAMGVPTERIHRTGLPLRRAFATPPAAPPHDVAPAVLLLGGRRCSRAFMASARTLFASHRPMRLVIACGDDDRARRRLTRLARGKATVLGWQCNMAQLMRAADVVVTKAGSATLAEAFSQARPVLTYCALPGQEDGNIALLRHGHLGDHVTETALLPDAIARLHAAAPAMPAGERAVWWGAAATRVAERLLAALPGATLHSDRGVIATRP